MNETNIEKEKNIETSLVPFSSQRIHEAQERGEPFVLVRAEYKRSRKGHQVVIPRDTVLATTRNGRKELESSKEGWRWAAGGALLVVQCQDKTIALVRHRDVNAPSYGDHWTLGSGLSSPASASLDLSNPTALAVREGVEEFIVVTPDGVVKPTFHDENARFTSVADKAVDSIVGYLRKDKAFSEILRTDTRVKARTEFQKVPGEENLELAEEEWRGYEDVSSNQQGIVVVDEKTRGIDFLKVIRINLPQYRLDELSFIDGELDTENRSHNNPVGCLEVTDERDLKGNVISSRLSRNLVRVFQNGQAQKESNYSLKKATPVLQAFFDALGEKTK